jgi:hypothetical protein
LKPLGGPNNALIKQKQMQNWNKTIDFGSIYHYLRHKKVGTELKTIFQRL